jgi:hypothetical protein
MQSNTRILRVRADEQLASMIRPPPGTSGGGSIEVPSREIVKPGERVRVEISFGPFADEIVLAGVVDQIHSRDGGRAPVLVIRIVRTHAHRMFYVLQVLRGQRVATARAHRRVSSTLEGRWFWGLRPHLCDLKEISRGGTFVNGPHAPAPDFEFEIEIRTSSREVPLRLPSRVVWVSKERTRPGFGVAFNLVSPAAASLLASLIETQIAQLPVW